MDDLENDQDEISELDVDFDDVAEAVKEFLDSDTAQEIEESVKEGIDEFVDDLDDIEEDEDVDLSDLIDISEDEFDEIDIDFEDVEEAIEDLFNPGKIKDFLHGVEEAIEEDLDNGDENEDVDYDELPFDREDQKAFEFDVLDFLNEFEDIIDTFDKEIE